MKTVSISLIIWLFAIGLILQSCSSPEEHVDRKAKLRLVYLPHEPLVIRNIDPLYHVGDTVSAFYYGSQVDMQVVEIDTTSFVPLD